MLDKIKYTILFQLFCKCKNPDKIESIIDESKDISKKLELGKDFDNILNECYERKDNHKELKKYVIDKMFDYEDEKEICGEE